MVFMGSEKYPVENYYDNFVSSHGGYCNAMTEGEFTAYHFIVDAQHFSKSLDIFAHCFISPLLSFSSAEREINAIESEFNLARNDDDVRSLQLLCHTAMDGHVIRKFSWGNKHSLEEIPRDSNVDMQMLLKNFHNKYYLPSHMKLVVVAPSSIEDLEKEVLACFSEWSDRDNNCRVDLESYITQAESHSQECLSKKSKQHESEPHLKKMKVDSDPSLLQSSQEDLLFPFVSKCTLPVPKKNMHSIFQVQALKKSHKLNHTWQLPSQSFCYRTRPDGYVSHLLGHEGKGSLLYLLKALNLASSLSAGISETNFESNSMYSLFNVSITLTTLGLANWTMVTNLLFRYLDVIKKEGPQEWIFNETKSIDEMKFRFLDEEEECDLAERLSITMLPYLKRDRKDFLYSAFVTESWDPKAVSNLLSWFDPSTVRIEILSSLYAPDSERDSKGSRKSESDRESVSSKGSAASLSSSLSSSSGDSEVSGGDSDDDGEGESDDEGNADSVDESELIALYRGPDKWLPLLLPSYGSSDANYEPFFRTAYYQLDIPSDLQAFWNDSSSLKTVMKSLLGDKHSSSIPTLSLPPPNPYIAEKAEVLPEIIDRFNQLSSSEITAINALPKLISVSQDAPSRMSTWHLCDFRYPLPKAEIYLKLFMRQASMLTTKLLSDRSSSNSFLMSSSFREAVEAVSLDIAYRIIADGVNDQLYMGEVAEIDHTIRMESDGLFLQFSGIEEKLSAFSLDILKEFLNPDKYFASEASFQRVKDQMHRDFKNKDLKNDSVAYDHRLSVLRPSLVSLRRKLDVFEHDATDFGGNLINRDYIRSYWEECLKKNENLLGCLLLQGNISSNHAIQFSNNLEALLPPSLSNHDNNKDSLMDRLSAQMNGRVRKLPVNRPIVVYDTCSSSNERNICAEVYFQYHLFSNHQHLMISALDQMLTEVYFDDLRTKQQLGYDVSCGMRNSFGVLGFCFRVVSSSHSFENVLNSINTFVMNIPAVVEGFSDETFVSHIHTLIKSRRTADQSLSDSAQYNWSIIEDFQPSADSIETSLGFDNRRIEANILEKLSQDLPSLRKELVNISQDIFITHSRKLTLLAGLHDSPIPTFLNSEEVVDLRGLHDQNKIDDLMERWNSN